jgi:hypothetical protein
MKKTILILMALASLTIANAEPVYGPFKKMWADPEHTHVVMARQLTPAAEEWMTNAQARGYCEVEAIIILQKAFYKGHNRLPPLPEPRSEFTTDRIVQTEGIAAIDLEAFDSLIRGMQACLDTGYPPEKLMNVGIDAGNLVKIPAGSTVTVHKIILMPKYPAASMVSITYQGRDLIMLGSEDTFAK